MFINLDSTSVLKAKLTNAVATSQLRISITYKDNTENYRPNTVIETNGTTAVTLLSAPANGVVNIVESIEIYNPDSQTNTVQILLNDVVMFNCTVGAGQSTMLPHEDANGLAYTPANADLNNLTISGKTVISNLALPSDSYTALSLSAGVETGFTAPADGYFSLIAASTAAGQQFFMKCNYSGEFGVSAFSSASGQYHRLFLPVRKNNIVYAYSQTTPWGLRFHYAQGNV